MDEAATVGDLLDRADAERLAGRGPAAARLYERAIERSQDAGELATRTRAVLGAADVYVFGAEPGRLPAQLHDVLVRTTVDADRARVAAALARCWAYAGHAGRATRFADEALRLAERSAVPELLIECLDSALASRWGPDDLDARVRLAAQLDETAAHVVDPEARLRAHLWGLQVACEVLDVPAIHRHLRGLEGLGEESDRAWFFAASRRLMLDLMLGRTDTAADLVVAATEASGRAGLADGWMVVEAMKGYVAVQSGDTATCAHVAAECEAFGLGEGSAVVCAEAAYLWLGAGRPDRARTLLQHTFSGSVLDALPRDVNWLLTLQLVLEVALAVDDAALVEPVARLLDPYRGRAVFNAGAVMFHGVTDDVLARAAAVLGDGDTAGLLRDRATTAYRRLGAVWWRERLDARVPGPARPAGARTRLHPTAHGLWLVGPEDEAVPVRALKGFAHLRELLRRPGREISALDLVAGGSPKVVQQSLGEVIDRQALEAYRCRLADLDREIDEAAIRSDRSSLDRLQSERRALVEQVAAATGLSGRIRTGASTQERARVAATKAIHTAIDRVEAVDPATGRHLHDTVRTGHTCSYTPGPDEPRSWILG